MKSVLVFHLLFLVNYTFGKIDRIAGGARARKDQFPFFAHIHVSINSQGEGFDCGGTLIYPEWILTAAHCFPYPIATINQLAQKGWIVVVMGTNKAFGQDGKWNVIAEVRKHPKYILQYVNKEQGLVSRLENDVAVARLRRPYEQNNYIRTIKLPNYEGKPKSRCSEGTIVGIGKTSFTGPISQYVMYANVHTKGRAHIISPMPRFEGDTVFYTEVEWYKGHALEGDSGGPYVCYNLGVAIQYGICSAGYNSSVRNATIVIYESVDKHLDFILAYTSAVRLETSVGLASEPTIMVIWIISQFIYLIYCKYYK